MKRELWKEFQDFLNTPLLELDKYTLYPRHIISLVFIIFFTRVLSYLAGLIIGRYGKRKQMSRGSIRSVHQIVKYFLYIMATVVFLDNSGVKITVLLAGGTALFVGIGLGLQSTFNDFVSGVIILFEGSVRVGDILSVDNEVGIVRDIKLRTSELETRDGKLMIIPNSRFVNESISNYTHMNEQTSFDVTVGVSYNADPRLVEKLMYEAMKQIPDILQEPAPNVQFADFGDSALTFRAWFYTRQIFAANRIRSQLRFKLYEVFKENNIEIPFPQRDVHVSLPEGVELKQKNN